MSNPSPGFVKKILSAVKNTQDSSKEDISDGSDLDVDNDDGLSEEEGIPYCDPPDGYVRLRPSKVDLIMI